MKRIWYLVPAMAWMIIIVLASLISARRISGFIQVEIFSLDKVVHCIIYLILSVLLTWGFVKYLNKTMLNYSKLTYIFLFSSSLGIVMEVLQKLITSTRHFDIYDIIANIIGALIGCILFLKKK